MLIQEIPNVPQPILPWLGTGLIGLAMVWLLLYFKPWKNGGSHRRYESSGDKSPEWWEMRIAAIVEKAMKDAMASRNEELRKMMKEVIGDWMDERFGRGNRD